MEDCLFCKIAAGDIPSKKLYEDEQVVAFYDIAPQAKVHFLVIPKKHIPSAAALTEEDGALLGHVFAVIAKLAREQGLDNGYRVISNVGADGPPLTPFVWLSVRLFIVVWLGDGFPTIIRSVF